MAYRMDSDKIGRLARAVEYSRRKMQPFREKRLEAIRQYVGSNYGEYGPSDRVPVNLMEMALSIYKRQVAARSPQVLVTSDNPAASAVADNFELSLNLLLKEIGFEETLHRWVVDAMFAMGIIKCGISPDASSEIMGFTHDTGQPFADNVDLEDFVFDVAAKRWDQIQFCGNRYCLPYEAVMDLKIFGKNADIKPNSYLGNTNEGGDERVTSLTNQGQSYGDESYMDMIELWDMWLPYEQVLVTIPAAPDGGFDSNEHFRVIEWTGPEEGPYYRLGFGEVPGNVLPTSPAMQLIDLHDLSNRVFRKLGRQAERQKTLTVVQSGAEEDGRRVGMADDGDIIRADRPESTREMSYGGVDQNSLAFMVQLRQMFSYLGGNLDTMGGLGRAADTVGQEKLISQSASTKISDMQAAVSSAVTQVVTALAKYLYHDPVASPRIYKKIPNTEITVKADFGPEMREIDFIDYEIDIAPYSMQSRSPAERVQTVSQTVANFILPMAQNLQNMGLTLDMPEFINIVAKYSNTPELQDIVRAMTPAEEDRIKEASEMMGATKAGSVNPAQTTRKYVRENVAAGMSGTARDDAMTRMLMGAGNQQSEAEQMQME
tara:strand:+ start:1289 stop:3094 length:1806 start_codon:yes stop_codon:yes gene_type:complete